MFTWERFFRTLWTGQSTFDVKNKIVPHIRRVHDFSDSIVLDYFFARSRTALERDFVNVSCCFSLISAEFTAFDVVSIADDGPKVDLDNNVSSCLNDTRTVYSIKTKIDTSVSVSRLKRFSIERVLARRSPLPRSRSPPPTSTRGVGRVWTRGGYRFGGRKPANGGRCRSGGGRSDEEQGRYGWRFFRVRRGTIIAPFPAPQFPF